MLPPEVDGQMRALTHLVTVLVQHIAETDEAWCRELLSGLRAQRDSTPAVNTSTEKAFQHAIAIVERALNTEP